jgi:flagellar hook-associated protein 1 FlgK
MKIQQIALSGAMAAQAALNTTSHNIANAMTPGFTRQGALFGAVGPTAAGAAGSGNGVQVPSLIRFSDGYKSLQLWAAASELGRFETTQPYLKQIEQVMSGEGSSLNKGLDAFFGALNAASVDPNSAPLRQQIITEAEALAQRFNGLNQVLVNQRLSIGQQRGAMVTQINSLSEQIAKLNGEITAAESLNINPSGLIDERDLRIDELAKLAGLSVVDQPDGSRSVSLTSGVPLVVGSVAGRMEMVNQLDGSQTVEVQFAKESFKVRTEGLSGQLGGLYEFEEGVLMPTIGSIASLAEELATRMNGQLAVGFAPDGTPGVDLFVFNGADGLLSVRPGATGEELAFSSDPLQAGNSDNLLAIIGLQNQSVPIAGLGTVRMGDVYTQLLGGIGIRSQQSQASFTTATTVRDQAQQSWASTSSVNTDEEAINLVQYQQMYTANMKVIQVAGELFDAVIGSLR